MAVDIEGFDIVFSAANANHARAIDQSIARMSEKVPTLSMGLSEMAKALDALGKINVDGVKKNLDAVKNSIENIDGSKLNKVFELATAQSEGLLNSVTSLVNMLGKVDLSSLRGGAKTEIYDERSRVTTTRETGVESQNQEQINALIRQREAEMQRLLNLQNTYNSATETELESLLKIQQLEKDIVELKKKRDQVSNDALANGAKVDRIAEAERNIQKYLEEQERARLAVEKARLDYSNNRVELEKKAAEYLKQFDDAKKQYVGRRDLGDFGRFEGLEKYPDIIKGIADRLTDVSGKKTEFKAALKEMESALTVFFDLGKKGNLFDFRAFMEQIEELRARVKTGKIGVFDPKEMSKEELEGTKKRLAIYDAMLPIVERYQKAVAAINNEYPFPTADTRLKTQEKWLTEATRNVDYYKQKLAEAKAEESSRQTILEQERKAIADVTNAENELAKARQANATAKNEKERALSELGADKGEKRLAELKAETAELEKQKNLAVKKDSTTSREVVIPVKFDERTILSEIKKISDQLATLFKDIPVTLRKELDLTFFAEKANELKKMFDGITVTGIQPTSVKKTENTVSTPKLDAGSSQLSTDSALVIEAAFERMNNLTNALIEKIRSIGTAENTLFTDLRTDIQGVSTALQGLVEQLSKVQEKSTRKKSAKKDDDAIVTEREVALTKEELARLDDLNSKLAKSNDLLAKKRAEQDAIVKASGTRDMFIEEEISRLETEIKAYIKAKQDLLVPKHGLAPSQSVVETEKAENAQLKLVKEVEEEANARQKNIAYLTQMISLIERMLKYGNFGQGVDMFSGMQQYFVDVQAKMKSLLKEQRTTTEQQIAQQNKATEDMALSYLKMINVQIDASKRKEREEQAYRERVLAAERAFHNERQKLYENLFAKGGVQDKQTSPLQAQINELNYTATEKMSPLQQQLRNLIAEFSAFDDKIAQLSAHTSFFEQKNREEYDKTAAKIKENEQLIEMARRGIVDYMAQLQTTTDKWQRKGLQSGIEGYETDIRQIKAQNVLLTQRLNDIATADNNAKQAVLNNLQQRATDTQHLYDGVEGAIARVKAENDEMIAHLKRVEEIKSALKGLEEEYNKLAVAGKAVDESGNNSQAAMDIINRKRALEQELATRQKTLAEAEKEARANELTNTQIRIMQNEYARLLVEIDKVTASRDRMQSMLSSNTHLGTQEKNIVSGKTAADNELKALNARKAEIEEKLQGQLDTIVAKHNRQRGEQAVKDFEKAEKEKTRIAEKEEREKTRIAEREAKKRADEEKKKIFAQNTSLGGATEFAKTANTINSLKTAVKYLQEALSKTTPNTPEWNNANKVYQETKKRLDEIKRSMEDVKTHTNSIIPSLKNLAMQFGLVFSVQQLNQWVQHMVEVRAQFELQNIALRSIIQNKEKADRIFAEVQQLALKSPFSIMQLNTYTKQMAAYGVEADKLVGTTKQLADVSAGLGVEMSRLILAYGQVKTANYLRATEVRQFTEAGLNITQELANYFTELNGKMVTAGEVTEMITKRMVKFEDVAEVFKRVTSAGGMFYEMQEKQSEGLQGQIQRIGDAYSIMLNDIGKSNQGTIAGVLSAVRELIQNWRVVSYWIKTAASAYLLYEAYVHRGAIVKFVTNLAHAWQLVTKNIHSSTAATFMQTGALGKLSMVVNGATTAVRGLGVAIKAALNATIILAIVSAVFSLINYFIEAKAKADQLAESLDNIDKEVSKEFDNSAAAYERLARAITDSSKTFDERNEAMSELKRTFKDILPDEYLQLSYIEQYAGHWDEAEKAMKQYYDSLALEKEKAAIRDANESELKDARKDIADTAMSDLGKDFGISEGQLQSFVDNILNQMLDGSITTTKQAVDEYIRQIENWNNKSLSEMQKSKLEDNLTFKNFSKDMSDLLDISKEMGEEYEKLADRQSHYATASEKAEAEADAMIKTRAEGITNLIDRTKSGLDQINAIQRQIAQVDMQTQNEETIKQKAFLQERLNEAIQQERDLYAAIGIEMPKSFEQVSATTINIRDEIARVSADIANIFLDGVDPAVIDLYESYKKLERVQRQLNDGTKRSQEEVARLRDIEVRSINDIKAKYRQMGFEAQGDIKGIASSQDLIRTEMIRVCDATREYFKTGLIDKLSGGIKKLAPVIEKFLSTLGIEIHFDFPEETPVETNIKPALDANKKLLENKLKINDKIINSENRLVLQHGQNVKDYVKNLKTLKEENDKIISQYDKAKDKKQWLSLQDEEYNTEAKIQLLREQSKAAKEIAEAYDPTIFGGSKKGSDKTEEMARKRFEFIKRANTEYEKLLKNYDAETARAKVLSDMMGEAKALGVDKQFATDLFTKASTLDTLKSVYDTFYRGIVAKYPKIAMEFQKTFNGIALDVDVKLREEDRDEIKKQMDELMGGYELAIELDKSGVDRDIVSQLFGVDTFDLSDVTEGFEKAWLDALNERAKRAAKATGDEFKAYNSLEEAKAKMGEEDVKLFESQQKKISDTFAKELRAREKEYAKYLKKSYSDSVNEQVSTYRQLRQLQMDADFKRNAIIGNNKLDEEQKQTALQEIDAQSSQIAAKMQEQLQEKLNKIQWEGFKDSPLFETVLSDIENLGTATLDMLIKRLGDLKETYKGLDPKNIKEIVKYIDQLTAQKIKNNPFKEWGNALREIHALKKQGLTLDKLNENLISDSDELTRLSAEIESYNKVLAIKQQMTHVTEQDVKLMQTDTQTLERQLRVLEEQKSKKSVVGVGADGSDESKSLDLQINKIQEILAARRTILASNGENITLSAKEISLLQQGSEEITKQVLLQAKNKGLKEDEIEKIKKQISNWDKLSEAQKGAVAILNEVGAAASAGFSVAEAAMNAFGGSSDEVTKAMMQGFDDCIQSVIALTAAIVTFEEAANAASGVIGIIAAALTAVASLFKTIFNVHEARLEKSIKEHQRQVKKLEAEYDNLSDAISNAFSGFQLGTNTQAAIQNLERQNEQYRAMIENEKDKKDTDKDKIADWEQTIADNLKKAQELRQQYFTELGGLGTGSDVRDAAEGFVDAWSEAFGETRDGISGLKEEFDDFMKNIVKKQAYMKIADHWISKFGEMINASFDKYGQVNYEKLQSAMKWFTEEAIPQMDTALEDMTDFWENIGINWTGTTSSLSGLAEGIQGITEETAQILEALLNSMRFYVADTNEQLKQIFNTMINPNEENPFLKELKNQTKYLASIDKRLDSVISATKRASGSHINVFTT